MPAKDMIACDHIGSSEHEWDVNVFSDADAYMWPLGTTPGSFHSKATSVVHPACLLAPTIVPAEWLHTKSGISEWNAHGSYDLDEVSTFQGTLLKFVLSPTITRTSEHLRQEFEALVTEWQHDTMLTSSSHEICMHPAYQRVIGIGEQALPFIMEELSQGNDHWHWALCAITGENPATHTDSLREASKVWLEWGKERGFVHKSSE